MVEPRRVDTMIPIARKPQHCTQQLGIIEEFGFRLSVTTYLVIGGLNQLRFKVRYPYILTV